MKTLATDLIGNESAVAINIQPLLTAKELFYCVEVVQ